MDLERIPLTPEILEKCGFEKAESMDMEERETWSIQVANNTALYYDRDHKEKRWYLSQCGNNNHYQNDFWNKPAHLHQLQNLYHALTGEELTVNL